MTTFAMPGFAASPPERGAYRLCGDAGRRNAVAGRLTVRIDMLATELARLVVALLMAGLLWLGAGAADDVEGTPEEHPASVVTGIDPVTPVTDRAWCC